MTISDQHVTAIIDALRTGHSSGRRAEPGKPTPPFDEASARQDVAATLAAFIAGHARLTTTMKLARQLAAAQRTMARLEGPGLDAPSATLRSLHAWASLQTRGSDLQRLTLALAHVYTRTTGAEPGITRDVTAAGEERSGPARGAFVEFIQAGAVAAGLDMPSGEGVSTALRWARKHDVDLGQKRPDARAPKAAAVFGEAIARLSEDDV